MMKWMPPVFSAPRCQAGKCENPADKQKEPDMKRRTLGVDSAKDCFQIAVFDGDGRTIEH